MSTPIKTSPALSDQVPAAVCLSVEHDPIKALEESAVADAVTPIEMSNMLLGDGAPSHFAIISQTLRSIVAGDIERDEALNKKRIGTLGRTMITAALSKRRADLVNLQKLYEFQAWVESKIPDADTIDYLRRFRQVHFPSNGDS